MGSLTLHNQFQCCFLVTGNTDGKSIFTNQLWNNTDTSKSSIIQAAYWTTDRLQWIWSLRSWEILTQFSTSGLHLLYLWIKNRETFKHLTPKNWDFCVIFNFGQADNDETIYVGILIYKEKFFISLTGTAILSPSLCTSLYFKCCESNTLISK